MSRPDYDEGTRLLFSENTSLVGAFTASVLSVIGTIGNLTTICALLQSRLRSHPTSLCLVALAASDLVFCLYNLPLTAYQYFNRGCDYSCLDWRLCIYIPFFYYGNIGVSLFIMALIAVHRVFGVFYGHLLNKYFTKCDQVSVLLLILSCFLFSFGPLHLPLTHTWGQFGFEPQVDLQVSSPSISCTLLESEGSSFLPVMAVFGVGLPSILIFSSYAAIYCKVRATGRRTRQAARAGDSDLGVGDYSVVGQTKQREKSLTRTFSTIFVAFIICFVPWCFLSVLDPIPAPFDQPPSQLGSVHMMTYILTWLSACINPVIYCLTNRYYREAHLELLRKLVRTSTWRSNPSAFTESTNLSIPLKKKLSNLSKPETPEQSDLSEPSSKSNIIVVKDSLPEKNENISSPRKEDKISTLNQSDADLPQPKTTFEELNASKWQNSNSKQQMEDDYELKCQQPIHLSASLQVAFLQAFTH